MDDLKESQEEEVSMEISSNNYYTSVEEFEVNIKHLTKGVIVSVGCKSFAFQDIEEALCELKEWYNNPKGMVKKYEKYINK